jgi:hypothetical protein
VIAYRSINREDVLGVTEFSLRALRRVAADEPLHVAPMKVRDAVKFFAHDISGQHFNLAVFDDGKVLGACALYAAEMAYFERREVHVMFCFAEQPMVLRRLAREMVAWFTAQPSLRRLAWAMNPGSDRMIAFLAKQFGFRKDDMLVLYK